MDIALSAHLEQVYIISILVNRLHSLMDVFVK